MGIWYCDKQQTLKSVLSIDFHRLLRRPVAIVLRYKHSPEKRASRSLYAPLGATRRSPWSCRNIDPQTSALAELHDVRSVCGHCHSWFGIRPNRSIRHKCGLMHICATVTLEMKLMEDFLARSRCMSMDLEQDLAIDVVIATFGDIEGLVALQEAHSTMDVGIWSRVRGVRHAVRSAVPGGCECRGCRSQRGRFLLTL